MSSTGLFNFGNSVVTIVSTLESVSSSVGSLVISGGVGIAKTLYVGTNIFLAGNAVSTQSYVQGLLSSYQPLTSGTPISALTLALTGTLDSTSISSGSLVTAGGLAIAKNLYVGTNIFLAGNAVATQAYVTSLGYLSSASAAATYLTTANAASIYQQLISGTSVSALNLALTGTSDSSSISTGSFITSGGIGISKSLYVGTNIFLAGSSVATQNFVTSLGYLTSAFASTTYLTQSSAAAVYQPLTANTAVSALTLSLTSTTDSTSVLTGSLTTSGGLSVSKNIFVGSALTSLFYNSGSSPAWYIIGLYDASVVGSSTVGCRSEIKILTGSGFTTGVNYGGCVTIQLTTNNNSIGTSANVSGTYFTTGDSSISVLNISFVQNGTNRFSYFIYANFSYLSSHTIHAKVPPGVIWTSSMTATTNPGANSATVSIAVQTFSATIAGMTIYSTSDSINSASGSLATFGGLGVAKSLYVGTNIFLAGSAVATQTFVTGLSYLTSTSAAATYLTLSSASATYLTINNATATYQPLTSGTSISALTLALTGTTDSASISTGSFVTAGGLAIAKSLYVGSNIFLSGSAVATQSFVTGLGYLTSASAAATYLTLSSASATYLTISNATATYQPLTSGTSISALTLALTGTTDSASISTGSFVTAGGLAIAKSLYVGSNIFLSGSAVATQSFVTGLGYLTSASAAATYLTLSSASATYLTISNATATYQPLTSGTSISALTLALTGTTDSASISTGSFVTAGGLAIAKSLYVGSNIFLSGSAVATQSFVTGLGYLTSASAAATYLTLSSASATYLTISNATATYQPLTSGTSISALTLALTGTTDSASISTGSFVTAGGLAIAKSLYVGSNIFLSGSAVATQSFVTGLGYLTSASAAATYLTLSSASATYLTISNATATYQPLTSGTSISALTLALTGTTDSASISTGSFVTAGGLAIAKSLYVGSNIFLAGSAVATQSFVTGLGYLTTTLAAAVYQPLISGTSINALTLILTSTTDSTSASTGSLTTLGGLGIAKSLYVGGGGVSVSAYAAKIIGNLYVGDPTTGTSVDNIVLGADANTLNGVDLRLGFVKKSGTYPRISSGSAIPVTVSISSSTGIQAPGTSTFTDIGSFALTGLNIIPSTSFVGTSNTSVSSNSASLTINGDIHFYNSTGAIVYGNLQGQSPPSVATRSTGTRMVFYPSLGPSTVDYAMGIGSNQQWYSVATGGSHVFYVNTVSTFSISSATVAVGVGLLVLGSTNINNTIEASNSTNGGSLTVSGGTAIAKSLYVGGLASIGSTLNMNSNKILNLATPTLSTDAANKGYVDSVAQGLSAKNSVVVASTAPLTLSTGFSAGSVVDGITLTVGMRILIKDQSSLTENGIYLVTATAPTRTSDFPTGSEQSGAYFFVESGTINADYGFVCVSIAPNDVVGTSISFSQFSGAGQITAGTGLTKSGSTLSINANQTQITQLGTLLSLSVSGLGTLTGTADAISSINGGAVTISGGLAVGKSLYSGTNIYMTGSLVATQSFVTGLGYLTSTSAAATYLTLSSASATYLTISNATATYQPLTSGTSISALTLALTGTTDSASISTGSFVTAGGLGIAKSLYVGSNIFLAGSAVATQSFVTGLGYLTSTSAAATYLTLSSASATYLTISNATATYQPLTSGTSISALTLALTGTTDSASISTGSFVTAGGLGIAKSLYVGSNIFLSGSAVATQSFVTGLGYLTSTSAAATYLTLSSASATYLTISNATATYQPLTSGTSISALTLALTGTTDSASISTGSFVTAGGLGIAKSLYVGTNIFLAGSAVATQSFVTGLGYLTSASAAATYLTLSSASATYLTINNAAATYLTISNASATYLTITSAAAVYQPLTAGTAISALSLSLTGTADSTSISTGSFVTAGGAGVSKNLSVGSKVQFFGTNSQYVALRAPASPANISLTLPASLPSVANSYLVSDTSGILSFSTSGGTGSSTPTSYSFSGANSQTTPANVTAMVYSSGNFELNVSVNISATTNLTQLFLISAVLSGGSSLWNINAISVTGDNSGVIFSITSAGQVQYTSSTYPGFTALTINWSTFISVTGGSNLVSGTNSSGTPSATSGALFYVAPSTFTDINTAASGIVSNFAGTYIGAPTLSASNTSITTTSASTMFIPGPPVAGTNETITNSYSLQVASGNVLLSGTVDATNSTSGGTLNTSGGVVIGKQLYAQQHKTISGTVSIPSAGTYYISFGMSGFIGKVSAYISSITNGIWASQGTILMPPGNLRANLSTITAYQYNSGAGSQIAASLQPFAGTNSNGPATDSPSNSVQVVVTTITSASTLVWSLIVFQNWI